MNNTKDDQSKGGIVRAQRLSPEERREIAIRAAEARWGTGIPRATHDGDLRIGSSVIKAAVLSSGMRLLSQGTFLKALGRSRTPKAGTGGLSTVDGLPFFLQAEQLQPFISEELRLSTTPILFRLKNGQRTVGYDAKLLPMVCEVYLRFRDSFLAERKKVPPQYAHIIRACDVLMRGLAQTGIIALVDEVTGYQDLRAKDALTKILEAFIAKELRRWVSTFPLDYYKELFRLRGWKFPELPADQKKRPMLVGKITTDIVYDRLAPGVRKELYRLTPRDEKGRLKHKLHQRLSDDLGHPKLREHLASVVTLMRVSDKWEHFMEMLNRALPRYGDTPYLPFND